MDLAQLAPMTDGRVATVTLPTSQRLRLAEMGLRPGAVLRVTQRAAFGGRVVALGAERFAVDAATCALIQVEAAR
ncbi:FeoA family protein [Cellulomonas sp. RIT-PI-Y]|jgi:ferrous iron transport protein A|uniref:FeoA family protein n=1 Tax=Cellulomonas sp. RIT-PI-Y TaxID=3035297 RepID=UPI0021D85D1C|nr:FeoA family protein [Cellulomonas sp. RIT-PI-Y]